MYTCIKCSNNFKTNYLLKRHESNKLPCDSFKKISNNYNNKIIELDNQLIEIDNSLLKIDNEISKYEIKILVNSDKSLKKINICFFCNKTFVSKQNTYRHINENCITKKIFTDTKNKFIEEKKA